MAQPRVAGPSFEVWLPLSWVGAGLGPGWGWAGFWGNQDPSSLRRSEVRRLHSSLRWFYATKGSTCREAVTFLSRLSVTSTSVSVTDPPECRGLASSLGGVFHATLGAACSGHLQELSVTQSGLPGELRAVLVAERAWR